MEVLFGLVKNINECTTPNIEFIASVKDCICEEDECIDECICDGDCYDSDCSCDGDCQDDD